MAVVRLLLKRFPKIPAALALCGGLLFPACPPAGAAPASDPTARVLDVRDFGGHPDDPADDAGAIRAAVQAAQNAGGGTVYFPPGCYLTSQIEWRSLKGIRFVGAGRERTLIRRIGALPMTFHFIDCRDLAIHDLTLDANGCQSYGGTYFLSCKRVVIANTRYFDSNTSARQGRSPRTDIYAYVFGRGDTHNEDVVITGNVIEDLQLEVDYCKRVTITGNLIQRPTSTAGIGTFSLQWQPVAGEDVCGEEILVAGNTIVDVSEAYTAIAVHLDPAVHRDGSPLQRICYRNIRIVDNTIIYPARSGAGNGAGRAIQVGTTDSSRETRGVLFDGIQIEGNRIFVHPSAVIRSEPGIGETFIFGNHSRQYSGGPDFLFTNVRVRNNTLYHAGGAARTLVRFYAQGRGCVEENNRERPYQAPEDDGRSSPGQTGAR